MNGGKFTRNGYRELPHTLVKDLFNRQRKHINKWNECLYNQRVQLETIRQQINKKTNSGLFEASKVLCLLSFKRLQENYNRMCEYSLQKCDEADLCCEVRAIDNETAKSRICYRDNASESFSCDTL